MSPVGASDPRPAEMLERHRRISRRRVGLFGGTPDNLEVWWSQILQAAAAEGLDPGTIEDWKGPNAEPRGARPVGASTGANDRPSFKPDASPSGQRAAALARAAREPKPPPEGEAP